LRRGCFGRGLRRRVGGLAGAQQENDQREKIADLHFDYFNFSSQPRQERSTIW
jgi:hypothetical protein